MLRVPATVVPPTLVGLALVAVAYPLLPLPAHAATAVYGAVAVLSLALGFAGLHRHRPARRRAWSLVLAGFSGWVVGDLVFTLESNVLGDDVYPLPSDAFYLSSYALLAAGALVMVRTRRAGGDRTALLDALIVSVGAAVLVSVFLLKPLWEDTSLSLAGAVVSAAYPVADLLLLAILVRLWSVPGARRASFQLLGASLLLTLAADTVYSVSIASTGDSTSSLWNDSFWLGSYVLVAAAACHPSMTALTEPAPHRDDGAFAVRRLAALACGLLLPALTLVLDGLDGGNVSWQVIGAGSILLTLLVLARMAGLVAVVQVQAVRLAALARSDALTGAPNRRTWDHELSRACQASRETGSALCVAVLDLDHFKAYNDTFGHQAGDRVLREAVAAWSELLTGDALLARYGGEEFALLLPGMTTAESRQLVETLRAGTPQRQTFSAGVALWDPLTDPGSVVAHADEALYDAKRAGRDRVVVHEGGRRSPEVPGIVLQPIVDLSTGEEVGVEALSRFSDGRDPRATIDAAHRDGVGAALEASALRAALVHRSSGRSLTVNVSAQALLSPAVADALPADLDGVVVDIAEEGCDAGDGRLDAVLADLRRRGARIAVDDWGRTLKALGSVDRIEAEIVKIDISVVQELGSVYNRAAVIALVGVAAERGTVVVAEGVETPEQWQQLRELGVQQGQGHLFGAPAIPAPAVPAHPRATVAHRVG